MIHNTMMPANLAAYPERFRSLTYGNSVRPSKNLIYKSIFAVITKCFWKSTRKLVEVQFGKGFIYDSKHDEEAENEENAENAENAEHFHDAEDAGDVVVGGEN